MSAPLTNGQKAHLAQLATRAFNLESAKARGRGETVDCGRETVDAWRHAEVAKATGKQGLRCCDQSDYKTVEAHFLDILGQTARAFKAHIRAATEDRRVIEYKITEACQEFGFAISYADKICRAQNKGLGLEEVDEKHLWQIFYTLRTRGRKKQSQAMEATHA